MRDKIMRRGRRLSAFCGTAVCLVSGQSHREQELYAVHDALIATDEAAIAELLSSYRCKHVYLDVGTNVGVQLRKLYEPAKYPKAVNTHSTFAKYFEADRPCGVCAIGIEPNPHHKHKLSQLQLRYRAAGAGILILHAAASDADGVAKLALGHETKKDPWEDLGASASEAWAGLKRVGNPKQLTVPVRAVDLSRIIHTIHRYLVANDVGAVPRSPRQGKIVMKLDIEGLEFAVLPSLIRSQALCTLDAIRIEWHGRFWDRKVAMAAAAARNLSAPREVGAKAMVALTDAVRKGFRSVFPASDCRTELIEVDDETYMHDRARWPDAGERICNRTR